MIKTWEVDVELRVRKTLLFKAPSEGLARSLALLVVSGEMGSHAEISAFIKWTDGVVAYRPMPVETVIDNGPQIVAVREILA